MFLLIIVKNIVVKIKIRQKNHRVLNIDCFKYVKDYDIQRKFKEHCITYQNKALSIIWED